MSDESRNEPPTVIELVRSYHVGEELPTGTPCVVCGEAMPCNTLLLEDYQSSFNLRRQ